MRLLALSLFVSSIVAPAQDVKLDAIRSLLLPMRADHTYGRPARGASSALTGVKHQLRDWVESRLPNLRFNGVRWSPDPKVLQEQLNDELDAAGLLCEAWSKVPCPDWTSLGFLRRLVIDIDWGALIVRTSAGIDVCGVDESAYAYAWNDDQKNWQRFWSSEQNDYADGKYFPQRLRVVRVSPADFRPGADRSEHLVLTLGVEPWCSSNWHDVYSRVWQTGSSYPEPRLLLDEKEWAFVATSIDGSVGRTDVLFEYEVPDIEGGFTRPEIRHYVLRRNRLERADPVALSPRQFTDYWLTYPISEIPRLTATPAIATLTDWRGKHDSFWEFSVPTFHCTQHPDLWQVGTFEGEEGKQPVYFLLRWRPPYHFTMVSARDRPWPDCTERDREADAPRSLFPIQ